ncbi:MAG: amino acid permease [Myxococcota bacterium]
MTRQLGAWSAGALVVANMVGSGAFTVSGFALAELGEPGPVLLAWAVGGAIATGGALCYGALGRRLPLSGGEYALLSRTVSPLAGFLAGWVSLVAGFSAPIALAALGVQAYADAALGRSAGAPWLGALAIAVCALAHALRTRVGVGLQNAAVTLKLAGIAAFVAIGALGAGARIPDAFVWSASVDPGAFALSVVWVSFAYSGWNAAIYVASELREPARLSRALVCATALVTLAYLALNAVFLSAAPAAVLAGKAEIGAIAAESLGGPALRRALAALVAFALVTSISSMLMAGSRVYAQMAEDGLLPRFLRARGGVPRASIALQALLALALSVSSGFAELLGYAGFLLSLSSAATVLALVRLRLREGASRVPLPGWPWLPIAFVAATSGSALALVWREPFVLGLGAVTLASALPVYRWMAVTRARARARASSSRAARSPDSSAPSIAAKNSVAVSEPAQ